MAEPEPRALLFRILKRRELAEVANRLLAFGLSMAGLYLSLLVAVLLFGLSLFGFHLGLYLGLSLLPFFLLWPQGAERLWSEVRRLDEDCLLEAYLCTSSQEHRAFMREAARRLLERRDAQPVVRFLVSRCNRRLALACGCLLLLFEAASYLTMSRLEPSLSPRTLRNRLAEMAAAAQAASAEPSGDGAAPRPEAAESTREPGAGETERQGEEELQREPGVPQGVRETGAEGLAGTLPRPERREGVLLPVESEEGGGASLSESSVPGTMDLGGEPDHSAAGAGDTGRSFLESPLQEYRGVPQRIEVPGGRELAAADTLARTGPDPELTALFGDFAAPIPVGVDFDPLLERIRGRYLELLDERF